MDLNIKLQKISFFTESEIKEITQKVTVMHPEECIDMENNVEQLDAVIGSKSFIIVDGVDKEFRKMLGYYLMDHYNAVVYNWEAECSKAFDFDNPTPDYEVKLRKKISEAKSQERPFVLIGFFMNPNKTKAIISELTEGFEQIVYMLVFEFKAALFNAYVNSTFGIHEKDFIRELANQPAYVLPFMEYRTAWDALNTYGKNLVTGCTHCTCFDMKDVNNLISDKK